MAGGSAPQPSAADETKAVIQELGRINGLALACGHADVVSHVKAIMIGRAPRASEYREAFEKATNAAFLAKPGECPAAAALNAQAEAAGQRLENLGQGAPQ